MRRAESRLRHASGVDPATSPVRSGGSFTAVGPPASVPHEAAHRASWTHGGSGGAKDGGRDGPGGGVRGVALERAAVASRSETAMARPPGLAALQQGPALTGLQPPGSPQGAAPGSPGHREPQRAATPSSPLSLAGSPRAAAAGAGGEAGGRRVPASPLGPAGARAATEDEEGTAP